MNGGKSGLLRPCLKKKKKKSKIEHEIAALECLAQSEHPMNDECLGLMI